MERGRGHCETCPCQSCAGAPRAPSPGQSSCCPHCEEMMERECPGKTAHRAGAWSQKRPHGVRGSLWLHRRLHMSRFDGPTAALPVQAGPLCLLSLHRFAEPSPHTSSSSSEPVLPLLLAIAAADYQHLHDPCVCHGPAANPTAPAAPGRMFLAWMEQRQVTGSRALCPRCCPCCKDLVWHNISTSRVLRGAARKNLHV